MQGTRRSQKQELWQQQAMPQRTRYAHPKREIILHQIQWAQKADANIGTCRIPSTGFIN
jgi:hypothetical protein